VIDEFVMAYQPRKEVKAAEVQGQPIPVVFIPRKPHPNGLEIFLATTPADHPSSTQEHLPFTLDIIPHLKYGDNAPTDVFRSFMKNWIADTKPEILADSVFGSIKLLKHIENWGRCGTFSMQSNHHSYIWEVLSANLPPNNWRSACNDKGWIAFCSCVEDPNKQKKT
jgi:hypothetical protein